VSDHRRWRDEQPDEETRQAESAQREVTQRHRRSNPVENLRAYIMVKGGVQRHDRLIDLDWLNDVLTAARRVSVVSEIELSKALAELREVFKRE